MRSAVGAKGMKIEGARSEGSGRRRIEDFLGKEDSPSRSASRWHRSICCSFFSPLFFFHYAKLSTARISLSFPPRPTTSSLSLCLPPFLPSLSPYFSLVSYLFPSFSLSFDFSLDFFENAAPIHHRCATIIMRNRCRSDRLKNRSFFQKPVRPRSLCEFYQILRSMIEHQPIVTGFRRTISLGISSLGMEIKWSRAKRWRDDRCCFGNSRDKILTTRMK